MLYERIENSGHMLWSKVEKLMQSKNYNQAELARRAGVNKTVISALRHGRIDKPSFDLICKLAIALDVSLDEFRQEEKE